MIQVVGLGDTKAGPVVRVIRVRSRVQASTRDIRGRESVKGRISVLDLSLVVAQENEARFNIPCWCMQLHVATTYGSSAGLSGRDDKVRHRLL